nr:uncharacterized protein LOC100334619 isoform X1 [Danio rerio]|eukprot:XP_009300023.1 uncharacterized protein LOC100334619 isoform X1 [Danio rerio]
MKNVFFHCVLLFTMHSIFGVEAMEMNVFEGDSLTLKTNFIEVQKNGLIDWKVNRTRIASVNKETGGVEYTDDKLVMFGDTLTVDQNGFCTIWSIRHRHYGEYEVESISSAGTKSQTFRVIVKDSQMTSDEVKSVAATEGATVTLQTDVELQKQDLILWRFGAEGHLIAKWDVEDGQILYYGGPDGRFRDRLQMERKNGSLTTKNIRTEDAGEFKLKIVGERKTLLTRFSVAVSASGLSPGGITGIVLTVLLLGITTAAAVLYYCYKLTKNHDTSEHIKQLSKISVQLQQLANQPHDQITRTKQELSKIAEELEQICKVLKNSSSAGERQSLNVCEAESQMVEPASPNPQNEDGVETDKMLVRKPN